MRYLTTTQNAWRCSRRLLKSNAYVSERVQCNDEENPRLRVHGANNTREHRSKANKAAKYRNVKVYEYADGLAFFGKPRNSGELPIAVYDSKKEYHRWKELQIMERGGHIHDLRRQVPLTIITEFEYRGQKVSGITYKADAVYVRDGKCVVEDVKPFDTATQKYRTTKDFNLKWKLLKAEYPTWSFEIY